ISGQSFEEYMQEHVLEKLHMTNSTFKQIYDQMPEIAENKGYGYEKKGDGFNRVDRVYINHSPAGSLYTTAKDMAYFMLAHLDENQAGDYQLFNNKETLQTSHEQSYKMHPQLPGN